MILRFKTKRDINGNNKYLAIKTNANEWSDHCSKMILPAEAMVLTNKDYKSLRGRLLDNADYVYVDYLEQERNMLIFKYLDATDTEVKNAFPDD